MPRPAHLNRLRSGARALAALAVAFVALAGPAPGAAAEEPSLEYQVKAAFLVKFAMFVEWPARVFPAPNSPVCIGILGADPFGPAFDEAVAREQVAGRPVRLHRANDLAELRDCQIVFLGAAELARLPELARELGGRPVLTVGEHPRFAREGGILNFIKEDGCVRFEVNRAAAAKAGLRLSAQFLQVARAVDAEPVIGRTGG